ncbi:hypothetical protein BVRB_6g143640 [Beta vulgaris subsp. vulgaris]|nr:hypothetical protein BVRB_6g143640 [Beta vulgaris subsp. vulgaris]
MGTYPVTRYRAQYQLNVLYLFLFSCSPISRFWDVGNALQYESLLSLVILFLVGRLRNWLRVLRNTSNVLFQIVESGGVDSVAGFTPPFSHLQILFAEGIVARELSI